MREIPIYQVDAFAARLFSGNPAAVCPLEAWEPDALLQAIAMENNLSETAFLVKRGEDYEIRWMTPTNEVDLCGHATLGAAYVIATRLEPGRAQIRFESKSGPLEVIRDGELFALDFPANEPKPSDLMEPVAAALRARPREVLQSMDVMAVFDSEAEVLALQPDMPKVAALGGRGLIVTAPGSDCDFVSRFFAPSEGVPEDPVCGSAHTEMTPYWAARLGKRRMVAHQVSQRGGVLMVEDRGARVAIAGQVVPYLEGTIRIPAELLSHQAA